MTDVNKREPPIKTKQSITDPGEAAINSRSPHRSSIPQRHVSNQPGSKASADYVVIEQLVNWGLCQSQLVLSEIDVVICCVLDSDYQNYITFLMDLLFN